MRCCISLAGQLPILPVSGTYYHQSNYADGIHASLSHYQGWSSATPAMHITNATDSIIQYVYFPNGLVPAELCLQYKLANGTWARAYWGGGLINNDEITLGSGLTPTKTVRMGNMPMTAGVWLQLTIKASDLGIGSNSYIYGIIYGLYGGQAEWDYASTNTMGVEIDGLSSGMTVKMVMDNGTTVSQTSAGSSMIT